MSLDAIAQVTAAEEATRAKLLEAQAEAKRIIADAERSGKKRIDEARSQAQAEVKTLLVGAEARAADHAKEVMAQAERDCDALRAAAQERLDKAADLITERVVNG